MGEHLVDVTFVLPTLVGGGAERVVGAVAEGLATDGLRVEVLSLLDAPSVGHRDDSGVQVRGLGAPRVRRAVVPLLRSLRERPPAIVVTTLKHVSMAVALASRRLPPDTRHLARIANTYSRELAAMPARRAALEQRLISVTHRRIDGFICVSDGVRRDLVDRFGIPDDRCRTIPNPVDVDRLVARAAEPASPSLAAPIGGTRFISVGRLEPQKDHTTLLRAYAAAAAELLGASLLIVGDGARRAELEGLVRTLGLTSSVTFTGFVANPYPLLAGSDVLVLSSRFEGMPNVLLEALALGRACVATDCPSGPSEILVGPHLGWLVPVGDAVALGAAMVEAARRPPDPITGPAHVRRHHSPSVVQRAYRDAIDAARAEPG